MLCRLPRNRLQYASTFHWLFFMLSICTGEFCDSGTEVELAHHLDVNKGYFSSLMLLTGNENEHNNTANTYSQIGVLSNNNSTIYLDNIGFYTFKLEYFTIQTNTTQILIWKQISWLTSDTIIGYRPINIPNRTNNWRVPFSDFNGLALAQSNETYLSSKHWNIPNSILPNTFFNSIGQIGCNQCIKTLITPPNVSYTGGPQQPNGIIGFDSLTSQSMQLYVCKPVIITIVNTDNNNDNDSDSYLNVILYGIIGGSACGIILIIICVYYMILTCRQINELILIKNKMSMQVIESEMIDMSPNTATNTAITNNSPTLQSNDSNTVHITIHTKISDTLAANNTYDMYPQKQQNIQNMNKDFPLPQSTYHTSYNYAYPCRQLEMAQQISQRRLVQSHEQYEHNIYPQTSFIDRSNQTTGLRTNKHPIALLKIDSNSIRKSNENEYDGERFDSVLDDILYESD